MRTKPTTADYLNWVTACLEQGRGLTDWEKAFLADMKELLEMRGFINDGQAKKLEEIYAAKTPL